MIKKTYFLTIYVLLFIFGYTMLEGQVVEKKAITLKLAKKICEAAILDAEKNNIAAVIAVVDDGGNLVLLEKMDNAQLGSIEVAIQKARTSIYFKRPTKAYEERVTSGNNAILKVPNVLPFEGGLPIIIDGQYIGAVGVSGGSPQQDGSIAKAGIDEISKK